MLAGLTGRQYFRLLARLASRPGAPAPACFAGLAVQNDTLLVAPYPLIPVRVTPWMK